MGSLPLFKPHGSWLSNASATCQIHLRAFRCASSGHCCYFHSLCDPTLRATVLKSSPQTDRKSSYLLLAVVTLDEPGNGSLGRARNALQEGAVVLRGEHHPVVRPIQVFCRREDAFKDHEQPTVISDAYAIRLGLHRQPNVLKCSSRSSIGVLEFWASHQSLCTYLQTVCVSSCEVTFKN